MFFSDIGNIWRFVLLSFVPGSGLFAEVLVQIRAAIDSLTRKKIRIGHLRNMMASIAIIGMIVVCIVSGPFPYLLAGTLAHENESQKQLLIYDSMAWIKSSSDSNTVVVSVDLVTYYQYLPVLFDVKYVGDYERLILWYPGNPSDASSLLRLIGALHFNYVAISATFSAADNYYQCVGMKLVFQNSEVLVFRVTAP
jgi:hypothetical protein